jgi:hypothetical protein
MRVKAAKISGALTGVENDEQHERPCNTIAGITALKNAKYERYCRLRASSGYLMLSSYSS